jgi:hypothetical protein
MPKLPWMVANDLPLLGGCSQHLMTGQVLAIDARSGVRFARLMAENGQWVLARVDGFENRRNERTQLFVSAFTSRRQQINANAPSRERMLNSEYGAASTDGMRPYAHGACAGVDTCTFAYNEYCHGEMAL